MDEHLTKDQKKELRKQEWEDKLKKEQKKKTLNKILLWVGVIVLLLAGFWGLNAATTYSPSSTTQSPNTALPTVSSSDITDGPKNAKAVLIEYADFQCPGCGAAYPVVKQLQQDFKGKLLFVYRFFPLTTIHKNAMASAQAAYAAYKQNKFWEMHDLLFANQTKWADLDDPTQTFLDYAKSLNLNLDQFRKDMADKATQDFINNVENKGTEAGVDSTPTFFLNKKQLSLSGYDGMKQAIQAELSKK